MPLHAVAYVSDAIEGIETSDIDQILRAATGFNKVAGVTGVLMFDGRRFLQYFEGPEDGVDSVFQRVLNARIHQGLRELARGEVGARHFARWKMASAAVEPDALARVIHLPWEDFALRSSVDAAAPTGFAALLDAWTGVSGELEPAAVTLGS
ncbi:MAG: BLUF domain-containing protein [Pseudoxanthomonas sp.]